MAGGALLQLVAYGQQDAALTGSPQITYFKNIFRRHTNFSSEPVEQVFQSNSKQFGNRLVATISRNGDLLHRLWLEVTMPAVPSGHVYVSKLGHRLLKSAEVEIGGQRIDKCYGRFMETWHQLACRAEKKEGYELFSGNNGTNFVPTTLKSDAHSSTWSRKLYLPINFWFSKGSAGAALPLIALQYHEVRIIIELEEAANLILQVESSTQTPYVLDTTGNTITLNSSDLGGKFVAPTSNAINALQMVENPRLYSDFFFLDTSERRRFSQQSHEYMLEQLQFTGKEVSPTIPTSSTLTHTIRLNFNHPTKAIYISAEPVLTAEAITAHGYMPNPFYNGFGNPMAVENGDLPDDNSPFTEIGLQLNGHDRFSPRSGSYFTWCVPFQVHTCVPTSHFTAVWSASISPEEHQPSGTLNFSRIDNAQLKLTYKPAVALASGGFGAHTRDVYIYALSYNVLRVLSGMAGLSFSN